MSVESLISYAYGVQTFQVAGPDWAKVDRFDIEAKFPDGSDKRDNREMLRALLRERFNLSFHMEQRYLEGDVLIVGRYGEQLKPSDPEPMTSASDGAVTSEGTDVAESHARPNVTRNPDGSQTIDMGKKGLETIRFDEEHSAMHYEVSKLSMEQLAGRISGCFGDGGHKVIDLTGIKGNYQVAYECPLATTQQSSVAPEILGTLPTDSRDGSALYRSLDVLGLKLEKRKMLTNVYVIDRVDRPSGN